METLKELQDQLKELGSKIEAALANQKTPEFERGKWYVGGCSLLIWGGDINNCTGIYRGRWDCNWNFEDANGDELSVLATPSEIQEALIKEAKKRGFKEGVTIKRSHALCAATSCLASPAPVVINMERFVYSTIDDTLLCDCLVIYAGGHWAEILAEPEIKIGSYAVGFNPDGIQVGCTYVSNDLLKKIYEKQFKS